MRLQPFGSLVSLAFLASAVMTTALLDPIESRAQEAPAPAAAADEAVPAAASVPLGRYIARDRLFLYVESAGLDAREEAWNKTAASRMLNQTSLGVMFEDLGAQLAERILDFLPNRKITGAEAVTIVEHLARKGWALALSADPQAPNQARGVLVLRGVVGKEMKPLFSRLMGSFMSADVKPKIERKGARVMVVVPPKQPKEDQADQGWVWWPEGDDLVVGLIQPTDADAVHAALDGQSPSVEGFEPIADLMKPEGSFEPAMTIWFDPAGATAAGGEAPALEPVAKFFADANVKRIDHRWGFDGDALVSVTRLTAPKPRKGILALFNEPTFEAKNPLAFPEGVDSFVSMSIKPEQWPEILSGALGSGAARAGFDAFAEALRARRADVEKDLLGNLGPRALFYLAPGGSAAAADDAAGAGAGLIPAPLMGAVAARIPRPVLVAEVADPVKFGRGLEALMFEVNNRIKAAALEQAAAAVQAEAEAQRNGPGGPGPGAIGALGADAGPGPGANRATRKRNADPPVPEFRLIPGSTSASERTYMFNVPSTYPIKPFPPGVKPTIRLEGNRLAISTSPEAARLAIETLRDKNWAPPADIAATLAKTPENSMFVLYGDSREETPTILASLPGALQAQINTAIAAASRPPDANQNMGGPAGGPGGRSGFAMDQALGGGPGGPSRTISGRSRMASPGGSGSSSGGSSSADPSLGPGGGSSASLGMGSGGPGGMGSGGMGSGGGPGAGRGGPGAGGPALIQIRVDPAHLPKADELKALMFPSTTSVVVDDETIRVVTREAFPDALALATANGALTAILIPAISAAKQAADAQAAAAGAGAEEGAAQPGGPNSGVPAGPGPARAPGGGGPMLMPNGAAPAPGGPAAKTGRRRADDK